MSKQSNIKLCHKSVILENQSKIVLEKMSGRHGHFWKWVKKFFMKNRSYLWVWILDNCTGNSSWIKTQRQLLYFQNNCIIVMYASSATRVRRQCNQPNSQAVDTVENYSKIKYVNPRQKLFVHSLISNFKTFA